MMTVCCQTPCLQQPEPGALHVSAGAARPWPPLLLGRPCNLPATQDLLPECQSASGSAPLLPSSSTGSPAGNNAGGIQPSSGAQVGSAITSITSTAGASYDTALCVV